MPVFYEGQRGTACCRWPGDVRVSHDEIRHLAAFVSLTESEFIQRFTRSLAIAWAFADREPNGEYLFLEGGNCSVQPVKPQQCRDFPNLWRFPGFEQSCRARPRLVDAEQYVEIVTQVTGRPEEYVRSPPHSH